MISQPSITSCSEILPFGFFHVAVLAPLTLLSYLPALDESVLYMHRFDLMTYGESAEPSVDSAMSFPLRTV